MTRLVLFIRKTLRDCSAPKLLVAFLIPYYGLSYLLAIGFTSTVRDDLGTARLFTQEQVLIEVYSQFSFVWLVTFPMIFVAILTATVIAGEAEKGTLTLLLSKPVRRWEPLLGKVIGIILFGTLMMLSGLLLGGVFVFQESGASAAALSNSIISLLPGTIVYAFFVSVFVTCIGTLVGVHTGSRLKTALLTAIVPVLFFAFIFVRILPTQAIYEDYYLYVVDVNYHFAHLYVSVQSALGTSFNPGTQQSFNTVSGVYDVAGSWQDPLLGGIVGAVPLAGYVPPILSVAIIMLLAIGVLAFAVVKFDRMDIS
jgi:ABC-2 type transport system permease protein